MKIGIMTFWESQNNYGQLLQYYALQTFLTQMGHDVFLIRYRRIAPKKKKSVVEKVVNFQLRRFIRNRKERKQMLWEESTKPRKFDNFRNTFLNFSDVEYESLEELKSNPPVADAYICGSDQVWNNNFSVSCEAFLLGFGNPEIRRVAYAASFGARELSDKARELFEGHLKDFNAISVREESGLQLCCSMGRSNSKLMPDPTLLFKKDEWLALVHRSERFSGKGGKHLFYYTLGNSELSSRAEFTRYFKELQDVEIVHVSANGDYSGTHFPTVGDWVHLIAQSNYVVTNSFHGVVFSIIFNKNFIVLPNTGKASGMNERILSLLGKLQLTEHIVDEFDSSKIDFLLHKTIDWKKINSDIEEWKNNANDFLCTVL